MDTTKLMYRDGLMSGERILVTGGGTGLGKEMAEGFLKLGAEVHICGRRGQVCEDTAGELMEKHGGKVVPHACDIRVAEAITDMNDHIWAKHGPLTGLINNAAGNFISRTEDLSIRGFDAISNIVFRGTFYMTHDIGKRWIKEGRKGSVCSILTTWVWNGGPFVVPSAMSKAAVNTMTQSLAVEWGRYGLRFNAIAPGPFPTEGMSKRLAPDAEGAKRMDSGSANPMGRVGEMHELVNLAVFLMASGAEYVNGQTIAIDGAMYNASGGNFSQLTAWGDAEWQAARDAIEATNAQDKAKRTV
ncbi:SDR family oxidoreductase [uncultured Hyphomonas sp.]|jgi:NAD(P)-dependent dehydrogenase (short-subunit alcohol dehydrogenase family)|uniref:SDR family oxidoreductase n=1 Tax=uncultured Hyphomonas sp. TaxID=225298 RepID=UPI000C3F555E|nr:short-chain dehydrogenase [Hyphomonadaceae bacterium]MBA28883.1 short-chain dehydrogenase [Hyphomonadaceae bacterium]MBL4878352.1 SDR family oxidoreductase [Hyphomonas sp.]|tara:strand:+ start:6957 stop:7859 length:903 start_codon:yes stop_codon:yes gene_type:complete